VDTTPPRVVIAQAGDAIRGEAVDGVSPILRVEIAIDTLEWRPVRALDGVLDTVRETFETRLPALEPGEHTVSVRAFDQAGNVGMAAVTVRVARR
jgi:hypothetical protein